MSGLTVGSTLDGGPNWADDANRILVACEIYSGMLEQNSDGVWVTARPNCGTENIETRWRARYVIGADGAHSTVRALLGVDFPGKTVLSSIVLADVLLTHGPTAAD